jgi:hypothetical protein
MLGQATSGLKKKPWQQVLQLHEKSLTEAREVRWTTVANFGAFLQTASPHPHPTVLCPSPRLFKNR